MTLLGRVKSIYASDSQEVWVLDRVVMEEVVGGLREQDGADLDPVFGGQDTYESPALLGFSSRRAWKGHCLA